MTSVAAIQICGVKLNHFAFAVGKASEQAEKSHLVSGGVVGFLLRLIYLL